jgi:hypothetical protein
MFLRQTLVEQPGLPSDKSTAPLARDVLALTSLNLLPAAIAIPVDIPVGRVTADDRAGDLKREPDPIEVFVGGVVANDVFACATEDNEKQTATGPLPVLLRSDCPVGFSLCVLHVCIPSAGDRTKK